MTLILRVSLQLYVPGRAHQAFSMNLVHQTQVSFNPALSNSKLAAIRSMGMGTLNKVVLHFSSVFWDQVDFLGHVGKDRRRWLLFVDMSRITNRPILVAMTGGPFAVFLERLGDTEVVRRAMTVVRTVYSSAPDPIASQVTRWKGDRFSRGSFSFIPPGCRSVLHVCIACDRYTWPSALSLKTHCRSI